MDHYRIGRQRSDARGEQDVLNVTDPATNRLVASVVKSGDSGVDAAVSVASEAVEAWQGFDPAERGRVLRQIADRLRDETDRLARVETAETGRPISTSRHLVASAADYFDYYAGLTDKVEGETIPVPGDRLNYTVREPLGVTGHLVPWNASLLLGARSIAPAMASGNVVVAKPAPEAPLSLLAFERLAAAAGLPDGAVAVAPGGAETGRALTRHEGVDGLVFTGSRETGKEVMRAAADNVTPVNLELGGKSPSLVFADADVTQAAEDTVGVFSNAGQVCYATTRIFVHEDVYGPFVDALVGLTESLTVGPGVADFDIGPLISRDARDRVAASVDEAVDDGATILAGGRIPEDTDDGNFYEPTLLTDVDDDDPVAREELFGPVATVHEFSSEAEAIQRANDTEYGLYAALWTDSLDRAHRVAGELEAGTVSVNEYPATFPQAPFGGYKESGIGREKGQQALEHYTQLKDVTVQL